MVPTGLGARPGGMASASRRRCASPRRRLSAPPGIPISSQRPRRWSRARLAIGYIRGVQAQGVVATVKHFVGNETEFERNPSSSVVDERTLRELYLLPFEYAVKVADVLALMTSYNRVNGCHSSDDPLLLPDILRREWGFGGVVSPDWWALVRPLEAARAGLALEIPGPPRSFGAALANAVRAGDVAESLLDATGRRLLTVLNRVGALEAPGG